MRVSVVLTGLALLAMTLAGCADSTPSEAGDEFDDLGQALHATDETGVIRGVVVDPAIVPLANVTVTVTGTELEAVTGVNGAFGFSDLEPGTYFLEASKVGYNGTQTSVNVEAGVDKPPVVKILLDPNPTAAPYFDPLYMKGYLTCGAAIFVTSVGCTTIGTVANTIGDQSIFPVDFDSLPAWVQGELVWTSTQSLSGAFIWEIVQSEYPGSPQPHIGYRETTESPALAYLDNVTIANYEDWILERGIDFRFFGGPHELFTGIYGFGFGITLEQETEVFVHNFYNFIPVEGWRFTNDGDPVVPGP